MGTALLKRWRRGGGTGGRGEGGGAPVTGAWGWAARAGDDEDAGGADEDGGDGDGAGSGEGEGEQEGGLAADGIGGEPQPFGSRWEGVGEEADAVARLPATGNSTAGTSVGKGRGKGRALVQDNGDSDSGWKPKAAAGVRGSAASSLLNGTSRGGLCKEFATLLVFR